MMDYTEQEEIEAEDDALTVQHTSIMEMVFLLIVFIIVVGVAILYHPEAARQHLSYIGQA